MLAAAVAPARSADLSWKWGVPADIENCTHQNISPPMPRGSFLLGAAHFCNTRDGRGGGYPVIDTVHAKFCEIPLFGPVWWQRDLSRQCRFEDAGTRAPRQPKRTAAQLLPLRRPSSLWLPFFWANPANAAGSSASIAQSGAKRQPTEQGGPLFRNAASTYNGYISECRGAGSVYVKYLAS